jgi:hypothetical protein
MKKELLEKFDSIVDYHSNYNESGGLLQISLETYIEFDKNRLIRMDIWITEKEFLDSNKEKNIAYRHQTAFQLKQEKSLSEDDVFEMFKFTETRFLNSKISFPNKQLLDIKTLLPKGEQLQESVLRNLVKQAFPHMSATLKFC